MTKNKDTKWQVVCAAILALTTIEIVALLNGVNGTFRMIVTMAIAGMAGFVLPSPLKK